MKTILIVAGAITITTACMKPVVSPDSRLSNNIPEGTKIFVKLAKTTDGLQLLAATNEKVDQMLYCKSEIDCDSTSGTAMNSLLNSSITNVYSADIDLETEKTLNVVGLLSGKEVARQLIDFKSKQSEDDNDREDNDRDDDNSTVYDWKQDIAFTEIRGGFGENRTRTYGSESFKDVLDHTRSPYLNNTPMTQVHETYHFLLHEHTRSGFKFIYHFDGKGAYCLSPQSLRLR